MDDQERNHEALIDRFAEQARIIRHRNDRIAEVEARANELALELAHAATRAEKAEHVAKERAATIKEQAALIDALRAEQPRPLTADDIEQLVTQNRCRVADAIRALYPEEPMATDVLAHAVMTALTEPTRPEEKVEAVLHQYWSGDINGDDLANRIVEEMNR